MGVVGFDVSSIDDGFSAGAYVGVYESSSEEAGAFDGFFDGIFVDDGFSAGAYVGVYESSSEEAGAFVVGISVFSFPPPSSSEVGV